MARVSGAALRRRVASQPSRPGMLRSINTKSGLSADTIAIPSAPSRATSTVLPARPRCCCTTYASSSFPSTYRILRQVGSDWRSRHSDREFRTVSVGITSLTAGGQLRPKPGCSSDPATPLKERGRGRAPRRVHVPSWRLRWTAARGRLRELASAPASCLPPPRALIFLLPLSASIVVRCSRP